MEIANKSNKNGAFALFLLWGFILLLIVASYFNKSTPTDPLININPRQNTKQMFYHYPSTKMEQANQTYEL